MHHKPNSRLLVFSLWCGSVFLTLPVVCAQKAAPAAKAAPLAAAKAQLDKGKLDAAEEELWKILGTNPSNEQALTMLGVIRGRQQRYPEAEALFRRVLQINPRDAGVARNLAGALLVQDKADEAVQQYGNAIKLSPQDAGLRIELAQIELGRGNFGAALSALDGIPAARFPVDAIPLKAASLLGSGRGADARKLIPQTGRSPAVALALAVVFVKGNEPDAALQTLALIHPVPKDMAAQVSFLKGRALRQRGQAGEAMSSFRDATTADPRSAEALMGMAETLSAQNKHAESAAVLQKAREANPESLDALRHFIAEAMLAGQNDRALQAAQDLQRKSTELGDRFLVASVMLQQKQYLPATHILEDYIAQRPQDAKAHLGLGIAYLSLLRYPEARQSLERSLQLDANLPEAEYQLGLLTNQEGKRPEAIQHWKRAVELQPGHAQALFSLGTVYLESGELAEAERAFAGAVASDPANMRAEYNLALVQNKLGKSEEAKRHFEHYRKMQEQEHSENGNPRSAEPQ